MRKILHNLNCPRQLKDTFKFRCCMHNRDLKDKTLLDLPKVNSAIGQTTFKYAGAKDWNSLPVNIREMISLSTFKRAVYGHLLELDKNSHICSV